MRIRLPRAALPTALLVYLPFCAAPVRPTTVPAGTPVPSLWQAPLDLETRDLFYGPWGREHAPDGGPEASYTVVERKHSGSNPGLTVRDRRGREWSVKQGFSHTPPEGPVEVVLSRILSAVGYHQPPVYYVDGFVLTDAWGPRREPGGRFRLKTAALKDRGEWTWQQNPAVGTPEYQGLLVILLLFNSSDLKNTNNTVYEHRDGARVERRLVVRDLGTALGSTGRVVPRKNDAAVFARQRFITGVRDGFVEFDYRGWHQELVRRRIRPADVGWACDLLARLDDRQWADAFRAGGYPPAAAGRFIDTLRARIRDGQRVARVAGVTR